jgi:hypothetical protein
LVKHKLPALFVFLFCLGCSYATFAQVDTLKSIQYDSINKTVIAKSGRDSATLPTFNFETEFKKSSPFKIPTGLKLGRLAATVTVQTSMYAATLLGLNELWYKRYDKSAFHTFDDGAEWQQMDKIAHAMSASTISNFCYYSYRWSGMKHKPALFIGCAIGLSYMTTIEILDGYSSGWGFSVPDMAANVVGTSFFMVQQLVWQRQYIKMKMSYHPTQFANYRPEALGENSLQRILKDYNGMTFWASMGSAVFVPKRSHFPRWICVSLGYGAGGMTGGFNNPEFNQAGERLPQFDRYRQFYLSLDVDFSMIKTRSKIVKLLLLAVNAIKIPFPALEYNTKGQFKFHYLYF